MSYRGGYLPYERRQIEQDFFNGNIKCMISTNALELGVDVGILQVILHVGFPDSLSSFLQQSGRSGRRNNINSLSLILSYNAPLDDYYIKHPENFFTVSHHQDQLAPQDNNDITYDDDIQHILYPEHESILIPHLLCAANELALTKDTLLYKKYQNTIKKLYNLHLLLENGLLNDINWRTYMNNLTTTNSSHFIYPISYTTLSSSIVHQHNSPSKKIKLLEYDHNNDISYDITSSQTSSQSIEYLDHIPNNLIDIRHTRREETNKQFKVFNAINMKYIDEISEERQILVFFYPGAIYYHQGNQYIVKELDFQLRIAYIEPFNTKIDYYTQSDKADHLKFSRHLQSKQIYPDKMNIINCYYSRVNVKVQVNSYVKKHKLTRQIMETISLQLPVLHFQTNAISLFIKLKRKNWYIIPYNLQHTDLLKGIHGICHILMQILKLYLPKTVFITGQELKANCPHLTTKKHNFNQFSIILYEIKKESLHLTSLIYKYIKQALYQSYQYLIACTCIDGCPKCIHVSDFSVCPMYNDLISKKMAIIILQEILT